MNKEVPFYFRKCPSFLKERVPSKRRAPKFEMLPTSLLSEFIGAWDLDNFLSFQGTFIVAPQRCEALQYSVRKWYMKRPSQNFCLLFVFLVSTSFWSLSWQPCRTNAKWQRNLIEPKSNQRIDHVYLVKSIPYSKRIPLIKILRIWVMSLSSKTFCANIVCNHYW